MDTEETLSGIMPVIKQMVKALEQYKPKPDMTPDAQVLLQTSMAETERRKARDQAELQLQGNKLAADIQMEMKKLQDQQAMEMEGLQLKYAIAAGDNELKERIEAARLTRDAARLKQDQDSLILEYSPLGAKHGYQ
jgi:cell fate (sporulation/competence/biofilm development) regulator YmcA (YheA/YmcA/DUF963 family)